MHENPQVPNYVNREMRKHDFRLEPGLVLAVEPMVNMGRPDVDDARRPLDGGDAGRAAERPRRAHAGADAPTGVVIITADEDDADAGDVREFREPQLSGHVSRRPPGSPCGVA